MHELSIAERLLPPVLATAREHGAERVTGLLVRAGRLQQIVPESLELCFRAVSEGTAAEGAKLRLEVTPIRGRCRRCGLEFEVDDFVFVCPSCDVADVETLSGTELLLAAVELEA